MGDSEKGKESYLQIIGCTESYGVQKKHRHGEKEVLPHAFRFTEGYNKR